MKGRRKEERQRGRVGKSAPVGRAEERAEQSRGEGR